MRLQKMRLRVLTSNSTHPDTNGDKFRIYGISPESSGFDAKVGDYNGFLTATASSVFTISSVGAANIDITDTTLLRFIQNKANRKKDLYLMMRSVLDITDTDPTGTNSIAVGDPKHGTTNNKPVITFYYTSNNPGQGKKGQGFSSGNASAADGTGFGTF
jgi:hypothetical protein